MRLVALQVETMAQMATIAEMMVAAKRLASELIARFAGKNPCKINGSMIIHAVPVSE